MYNVAQGVFYNGVQSVSPPGGGGGLVQTVRQVNDLEKFNNTLTNTDLSIAVTAGQVVTGYIWGLVDVFGAASGSQYFLSCPGTPAYYRILYRFWDPITPQVFNTAYSAELGWFPGTLTSSSDYSIEVSFGLQVGATAGNLVFQFAQFVTDAVDQSTFKKGAYMNYTIF